MILYRYVLFDSSTLAKFSAAFAPSGAEQQVEAVPTAASLKPIAGKAGHSAADHNKQAGDTADVAVLTKAGQNKQADGTADGSAVTEAEQKFLVGSVPAEADESNHAGAEADESNHADDNQKKSQTQKAGSDQEEAEGLIAPSRGFEATSQESEHFEVTPYRAPKAKESFNYAAYYDKDYANGYHADLSYSHGVKVLMRMPQECLWGLKTMIDIGCSHGASVNYLWSIGKRASGMDVSSIAVSKARKARIPPVSASKNCIGECFRQGSATSIPWPDKSVDAVFSTEMLEHIDERDVPTVCREFRRLVKPNGYLITQVHSSGIKTDTHRTLYGYKWWQNHFENAGFRLLHYYTNKAGMIIILGAGHSKGCLTNCTGCRDNAKKVWTSVAGLHAV